MNCSNGSILEGIEILGQLVSYTYQLIFGSILEGIEIRGRPTPGGRPRNPEAS